LTYLAAEERQHRFQLMKTRLTPAPEGSAVQSPGTLLSLSTAVDAGSSSPVGSSVDACSSSPVDTSVNARLPSPVESSIDNDARSDSLVANSATIPAVAVPPSLTSHPQTPFQPAQPQTVSGSNFNGSADNLFGHTAPAAPLSPLSKFLVDSDPVRRFGDDENFWNFDFSGMENMDIDSFNITGFNFGNSFNSGLELPLTTPSAQFGNVDVPVSMSVNQTSSFDPLAITAGASAPSLPALAAFGDASDPASLSESLVPLATTDTTPSLSIPATRSPLVQASAYMDSTFPPALSTLNPRKDDTTTHVEQAKKRSKRNREDEENAALVLPDGARRAKKPRRLVDDSQWEGVAQMRKRK
jgi:hypothetical protein